MYLTLLLRTLGHASKQSIILRKSVRLVTILISIIVVVVIFEQLHFFAQ